MRGGVGAAAGEQLGRSDSRKSVGSIVTLSTVTKQKPQLTVMIDGLRVSDSEWG